MTTYQTVKKELGDKKLTPEQKAKLESLRELEQLEKLAKKVKVSSADYPLLVEESEN